MIRKLITPGFRVAHQWPVNLKLGDEIDFEAARAYETADSHARYMKSVWVTCDSVIYKNGLLIKDSLAAVDQIRYYQGRYFLKNLIFRKKKRLPSGDQYLLLTDFWSAGHFHWISDVLPRVWSYREFAPECVLLLPDNPYIRNVGALIFKYLGIRFKDIIWMKSSSVYYASDLVYLEKICPSGRMHSGIIRSVQSAFRDKEVDYKAKLYVTRRNAAFRKVVNEQELMPVLKEFGFQVIANEDLSLHDQIRLYSGAEIICGIHGAGLANAIFMKPGSKMIELRRKENAPDNVGYWHLADSLGQLYFYFNGIPDTDMPLVGRGCNLNIPVNKFQADVLDKLN